MILAIGQSTDLSLLAEAGRLLITEHGTIRVDDTTLATPIGGVLAEGQTSFATINLGFDEATALREARRCLGCDLRLQIGSPVLPPESWLKFHQAHVAPVAAAEGIFQLLDENKQVLRIAGTTDLRQALEEQLGSNPKARYFIYEEAPMYTQRESELLQRFLREHGRLPSGNDLGDDLF